ncbi:MAG TPA: TetR/AcrR family transcriptional regulator [Candidatus Binataceae bacterium]
MTRKEKRGRPTTPFLRERILHSASELFGERDFDLVVIDEVAARAKVGKGSVYRQFGSKEELYAAVVISGFMQLQAEIREALAGNTSMRDQIATIVRHTLAYFWDRQQFFVLLRDPKALPRRLEQEYRTQRAELARLASGVLAEGIASGAIRSGLDTRVAAESLLGMLRGINRYCREYSNPDGAAQTVVSIFLNGCIASRAAAEIAPAVLAR